MRKAAKEWSRKNGHTIVDNALSANCIIDCCGYWCGDPWGTYRIQEVAACVDEWKRDGKSVMFLPQTFGPFSKQEMHDPLNRIVEQADLVCTRDHVSHTYVTEICGKMSSIRHFPDYTMSLESIASTVFQPHARSVAIIPNMRMMDKTPSEQGAAYVPFLSRIVMILRVLDADPFLLIHEEKDIVFGEMLAETCPYLQVIHEPEALCVKWIIGQSQAIVSSRYHGILNALYQDVPVLATSWCHKFPALMAEWGQHDSLLDVQCDTPTLQHALEGLLERTAWQQTAPLRRVVMQQWEQENAAMWQAIRSITSNNATLAA